MTRPDPRLLVPCEALPFVPDGARVWSDDPDANAGRPWVWGYHEWVPMFARPCSLDLSAPALRDGIPERLDALPWALAVLGWREAPTIGDFGYVAPLYVTRIDASDAPRWSDLDLTGLTPDEASRAVVAAALRGGR
jgi:hypothetical protein